MRLDQQEGGNPITDSIIIDYQRTVNEQQFVASPKEVYAFETDGNLGSEAWILVDCIVFMYSCQFYVVQYINL